MRQNYSESFTHKWLIFPHLFVSDILVKNASHSQTIQFSQKTGDSLHKTLYLPVVPLPSRSCRSSMTRSHQPCRLTTRATRVKSLPGLSSCWLLRCVSSRCRLSSVGVTTTSFLYLLSSVENEQHGNTQRYNEPSCFWGICRCKWGGGNCDDLIIQRDDVDENVGLGDSSSNIKIARALKLKKNRVRMYNIQKNKSIKKCEIWLEMECK